MKNTLETRLGIFFALCFIVAVIILEMVGVADYFKPGYLVSANFKTVQDLKKGDLVKVAGVEVGRVDSVDLGDDRVLVTMKIKKSKAQIRADSKATIKFTGLMGQNFVAIGFGSPGSPVATNGTVLSVIEQPDLSMLMSRIDEAVGDVQKMRKDLSSDNLSSLLGPLTHILGVSSNDIVTTIGNMRKVSDQVASGEGTVGKLLYDKTLYNSAITAVAGIQSGVSELKGVATDARSLIADVNAGKGTIGLLLRDDALYREATNTMVNFREISQKVNRGQGSVGKFINDDSFYKNAKVSLQKLDKAMEGMEDQGPLSVLGIAVGTLF